MCYCGATDCASCGPARGADACPEHGLLVCLDCSWCDVCERWFGDDTKPIAWLGEDEPPICEDCYVAFVEMTEPAPPAEVEERE